jgi:uncharacterized ion transporter superfamily protein YfcC
MKAETKKDREGTLISISAGTFIRVTVLLLILLVLAVVLTYVIPSGSFGRLEDGSTDYSTFTYEEGRGGIAWWRGLLAPVLVFGSQDGLSLVMLTLFLLVISAVFQVMNDVGGISAIVGSVSGRFGSRRRLLLAVVSFLFMCFGAFLGLFEEMLTMLPVMTLLCVGIGYDSFTGFLVSVVACGFGFASAVTNPFTVLLASDIIGANPLDMFWFRLAVFAAMYLLLLGFILLYASKIEKDPAASLTLAADERLRASGAAASGAGSGDKKKRVIYTVFLTAALALIIVSSSLEALRSYTVVVLLAYFLIFGTAAGLAASGDAAGVFRSFGRGFLGALPTVVFIALASSVKFVLDEGGVLPTVVRRIDLMTADRSPYAVAAVLYLIILALEFFISSSTAKAFLVMGILAVTNVGLSKNMLVLLYTFADGYTNLIFPTSPVLLISLSMIGFEYYKWVRKSLPLFALNLLLVAAFTALGIALGL